MHQAMPEDKYEYVHLDITASPLVSPPPEVIKRDIPEKLLKILAKYEYNWRIDQLARPKRRTKRYVESKYLQQAKKLTILSEEKKFFSDQMSRARLRELYINRRLYAKLHKQAYNKAISKTIDKSWKSIYNFYKYKERERTLRKLRQEKKKSKLKKAKEFTRYNELAKPKPVFKLAPIKKKPSKIFSNYNRLEDLAAPKPYVMIPQKSLDVNPAALTYEPTETVIRLAKIPPRFLNIPKPLEPGKVKRAALRYNATPRMGELAQPKQTKKNEVEDDFDPWAIPKSALTYKATPRILEMAKPKEWD